MARHQTVTRARYMFKLKALLEERFNDLVKICSMEAGKTLEESRGEVRRGIEVVEVMAGIASLMKGQAMEDIVPVSTARHFASRRVFSPPSALSTFRNGTSVASAAGERGPRETPSF